MKDEYIGNFGTVMALTAVIVVLILTLVGVAVSLLFNKPEPKFFNGKEEIAISREREEKLAAEIMQLRYITEVLTEKISQ